MKAKAVRIGQWRKAAIEQMAELFVDGRKRKPRDGEVEKEALFEEIGRLKMELDWLKKSWSTRLRTGARWWRWRVLISALGDSASCWASTGRASTIGRACRLEEGIVRFQESTAPDRIVQR